ncbi:MAG: hypothetical protein OXD54_11660 [Candidatus Poribacteria bacterium]|nr:hypothetical protein [Candidatus Poribacteria bacterium]
MATIVRHDDTGKNYCLLGTGFGVFQSSKPNVFFGNLMADVDEGEYAMVCVCDKAGEIYWIDAAKVTVVSVDGHNVGELPLA